MTELIVTTFTKEEFEQIIEQATRRVLSNKEYGGIPGQDVLFDVDEAASFLKVSKSRMYKLTSLSEIPHIKKGKRLYFSKTELIEWIKTGKQKTKDDIEKEASEYIRKSKFKPKW